MEKPAADKINQHSHQPFLTFLNKNKNTILPIIVFCLPVLLYMPTVGFGFSYFDDHDLIINKIGFLSDFRNAPQAFVTDASLIKSSRFYRPLQTLSYMMDIQLSGGNNPWMYHLTNVLLSGLTAWMLFLLLRKFPIPLKAAFIGTLLYSVHPLFTIFTAWIPSRGDVLLTLFSLLSFLFLIEHLQKKKAVYLLLHWAAFTIALFCKETAALLPLLFIIYYFTFSFQKPFEKKYLINIALYGLSGMFWLWLRSIAIGVLSMENEVGLFPLISNLRTIPESLTNFFLPFNIELIPSFSLFKTLVGAGLIVLMVVIFFLNKDRSKKEKFFCLAWFFCLLLPTLLYKEGFIDYLSHRLFLPLIGILLFGLLCIPKKWLEEKKVKRKILVNGGSFGVFALLSIFTFINSRPYSGPIAFWNTSISQNPNNPMNYVNRGYVKLLGHDVQGAIEDYSKAVELNPIFAPAYYNRGNAYAEKGDFDKAIKDYDKAIELNPRDANIFYNRGNAYAAKGDAESAVKDYRTAIELYPKYAEAYNNLGLAYQAAGDRKSALREYDKAIESQPSLAEAYYNRGNLYLDMGDFKNAIRDYLKAVDLNPNYAEAYNNAGLSYQAVGDQENALEAYDKAIELKPGLAEAYYNRGNFYLMNRNFNLAIGEYDKAIEVKPDYAQAYGVRGIAYSEKGDLDTAIKDYRKAIEMNPGDANAYGNLGNAYKAKGMHTEAERNFHMYRKLTP
ncbi:MAG: tetratricopeptide repeat protein [Spirochaetales bacterium]|nr:tetratricopeptide repeat protein [Spirochaetales bacterium]